MKLYWLFQKLLRHAEVRGWPRTILRIFTDGFTLIARSLRDLVLRSEVGDRFSEFKLRNPQLLINKHQFRRPKHPRKLPSIDGYQHSCSTLCSILGQVDIGVVIPTIGRFAHFNLTLLAIDRALNRTGKSYRIYLMVDRAISTDELANVERAMRLLRCGSIRAIQDHEVKGFGELVNHGSQIMESELLVILNDDAILDADSLKTMLSASDFADADEILSPLILNPDRSIQEASSFADVSGVSRFIANGQSEKKFDSVAIIAAPFQSAVCWVLKREEFTRNGGFRPYLKSAYYEDFEYVVRTKAKIKVIPRAKVTHFLSSSSRANAGAILAQDVVRHIFTAENRDAIQERMARSRVNLFAFYSLQGCSTSANAKSIGRFHSLPHLPSELGSYAAITPELLEAQSRLAAQHGVAAFAVLTHWADAISGVEPGLASFKDAKMSNQFFLFWTSEVDRKSSIDFRAFIKEHSSILSSSSYVKISGKRLLFIDRDLFTHEPAEQLRQMRESAAEAGLGELYLAVVESRDSSNHFADPRLDGFDAAAEYPPRAETREARYPRGTSTDFRGRLLRYEEIKEQYQVRAITGYPTFKSVMTGFDDSARLGNNAKIVIGGTLQSYFDWLSLTLAEAKISGEQWVGVCSWNAWNESAFLEPSQANGRNYLFATKSALDISTGLNQGVKVSD